jgi:Mechanosensitive ion channel
MPTAVQAGNFKRTLLPLNDLVSWVVVGLSGIVCLRILGVDPSPILALGSVSGIVVGFASQNLLLNLISGISIFLTRPFVVGDMVAVRQGATLVAQGTIANISPLRTTFLDEQSRSVTLPNKVLTDMVITNFRKSRQLNPVRDPCCRANVFMPVSCARCSILVPCAHVLKLIVPTPLSASLARKAQWAHARSPARAEAEHQPQRRPDQAAA